MSQGSFVAPFAHGSMLLLAAVTPVGAVPWKTGKFELTPGAVVCAVHGVAVGFGHPHIACAGMIGCDVCSGMEVVGAGVGAGAAWGP